MVKVGWKKVELGNFLDFFNGKSIKAKLSGKYKIYGSNGTIGWSDEAKYENAMIIGRVGAYCGSIEYESRKFWASDNTIVTKPKKKGIEKYIYYLLKNYPLNRLAGGSAQPLMTQIILKKVEVKVPESDITKQKIALILSNYDDLIENNTKRIELLEKIATLIYDEWFVKFRFPGHEKVKMVDSELGKIPEGWDVKCLYDVAEVLFGFALKSKLFCNDNSLKSIVRIRDIPKNKTETYSPEEIDEKYLILNSDFLIGMDGIFHMCNWSGGNAYLNQRVARLRPLNDASKYYLFHAVKPNIERLNNEIVGTTVQHLSKGDFDRMKLIVPEEKIMRKFKEIVDPIYFEEIKLRLKNQNLRKTRDLLLPKLISGQVDVSDLDIKVPEMQEVVV